MRCDSASEAVPRAADHHMAECEYAQRVPTMFKAGSVLPAGTVLADGASTNSPWPVRIPPVVRERKLWNRNSIDAMDLLECWASGMLFLVSGSGSGSLPHPWFIPSRFSRHDLVHGST